MLAHSTPHVAPLQVPRFVSAGPELAARWGAPVFVVVAPGEAAGAELSSGDLLITGGEAQLGDVVMLQPRGRGRPMLGRVGRRGLVAEPGGVPCSADRWRAVGRVAVRVRPEPEGSPRVLHFPAEGASEQQALPLAAPSDSPSALLRVALAVEGELEERLERLLAQRLPELRRVNEGLVIASCGPAFAKAPMELAESLVVEVRRRFGVNLRVVVARGEALAAQVIALTEPGSATVARSAPMTLAQPALPVAPRASAAAPAPVPRRQLGLWG